MNSIDHIMRIIADSREELRSEFEKPSNPISENESCRRSAMSDERTILDYLEDISNAILDIRSFVHDLSAEGFLADKMTLRHLKQPSRLC